jgi:hypothetical protein
MSIEEAEHRLAEVRSRLENMTFTRHGSVQSEARNNWLPLVLRSEDLQTLGKPLLNEFLEQLRDVSIFKWENIPCIFYCWFDDMARHIRICTISASHGEPPFGIRLNKLKEISQVVDIAFRYVDEDYFNPDISVQDIYVEASK